MDSEFQKVAVMDIREVVKDPEWQSLRKSFVGTWKRSPVKNVAELVSYLGEFKCPYKLRRVHNYLTGSGFRIGIISSPAIDELREKVKSIRYQNA